MRRRHSGRSMFELRDLSNQGIVLLPSASRRPVRSVKVCLSTGQRPCALLERKRWHCLRTSLSTIDAQGCVDRSPAALSALRLEQPPPRASVPAFLRSANAGIDSKEVSRQLMPEKTTAPGIVARGTASRRWLRWALAPSACPFQTTGQRSCLLAEGKRWRYFERALSKIDARENDAAPARYCSGWHRVVRSGELLQPAVVHSLPRASVPAFAECKRWHYLERDLSTIDARETDSARLGNPTNRSASRASVGSCTLR